MNHRRERVKGKTCSDVSILLVDVALGLLGVKRHYAPLGLNRSTDTGRQRSHREKTGS
jgi:hypothetical protein